jgi:hypothetical protein
MTIKNPHGFQTVEEEYLEVMPSTVRAAQAPKKDAYGKRKPAGPAVESPARLETTHESFTTEDGGITVANGRAFLGFVIPWLTADDNFEVQDLEGNWSAVTMVSVEAVYGPDGIHHQEVWYGGRGAVRGRQ